MKGLILSLLELSFSVSPLILLLLLLTPLVGKRLSARWRYWLWLLLALRLLIPFPIQLNIPSVKMAVPVVLTQPQEIVIEQEPTPMEAEKSEITAPPDIYVAPPEKKLQWQISPVEIIAYVWLLGAAGNAGYQLYAYRRYCKNAKVWSKEIADEELLEIYKSLCDEMNICKAPQLLESRNLKSPMLIGFCKPILFLPKLDCAEEEYRLIFYHELYHYKRHDLWYKLLLLTARCVHWFNPLVYLLMREATNDLEITCDEAVVKNCSNDERADYCETILRILSKGKGKFSPLCTGFHSGQKVLQRRFEMIMNDKAGKGIALGLTGAVLIVFLGGFVQLEVQEVAKEEVSTPREYLAVPEVQRDNAAQLSRGKMVLPVKRDIDFWEDKARLFFYSNFELRDDLTHKEVGDFFNVLVSDHNLYDQFEWGGAVYLIPGIDIRAILYSHLPDTAVEPEDKPYSLDLVAAFNEDGNQYFPYNKLSKEYTFIHSTLAGKYDSKAMETIYTEKVPLEDGCDLITIELASYDKDKYYASPQEKVVLETYRFSVKVADDSWFIEEATITKAE